MSWYSPRGGRERAGGRGREGEGGRGREREGEGGREGGMRKGNNLPQPFCARLLRLSRKCGALSAEPPSVFRQRSCPAHHLPIPTPLKLAKKRVSAVPWKYVISALNCQLPVPGACCKRYQFLSKRALSLVATSLARLWCSCWVAMLG